jgi:hypothetical protein
LIKGEEFNGCKRVNNVDEDGDSGEDPEPDVGKDGNAIAAAEIGKVLDN